MASDISTSFLSSNLSEEIEDSRITRSNVWEHCRPLQSDEPARDKQGRLLYYCKYCNWVKISTTNFRQHLHKKHQIICTAEQSSIKITSIQQLTDLYEDLKEKNATSGFDEKILKRTIHDDVFKQCLIDLVTVRCLPLSIVEWQEFHTLCRALNPESDSIVIPTSHNTMRRWVEESFSSKKDITRKTLQSAKTRIHISIDAWTSPNNYITIAICAHFVDVDERLQTMLIALRNIDGQTGEAQFEQALLPVLKEYKIARKIGAVVSDNATSNDTLCRTIGGYLRQEFPRDPEWISTHHRIRCLGHILNLVVQAFLFPREDDLQIMVSHDHIEELEGRLDGRDEDILAEKERNRRIRSILGPLGKLHNIIVHIRRSPQRTAEFTAQAGRRIPLDNRTRWNSWHQMLHAIFQKEEDLQVETALSKYSQKHSEQLIDDILDTREWMLLRSIYIYLSCFSSATLVAEGHEATLENVLDNLDICWDYLQQQKVYIMYTTSLLLINLYY
jgi:hypothetical protein